MQNMWRELGRELRWFANSRTALALVALAIALAAWGAIAGATSSLTAIASFQATLARYKANGEDIAGALGSPSIVQGDQTHQIISNSLRHDLDQASFALTQLQPTGAICSTLSLCALIAFPILGFVLGVFVSTHDFKSGSIVFRWPRSGIVPFASSKPLSIVLVMSMLAGLTGVISVPFSWVARIAVGNTASDIATFEPDAPSIGRVIAIAALSVLGGIAAAALGLLVGSVTRNRTFTVAVFVVAYLLVPLLGSDDPRNLITVAGSGALYFAGQFRPIPIGGTGSSAATGLLVAIAIVLSLLSAIPWLLRSRTERVS